MSNCILSITHVDVAADLMLAAARRDNSDLADMPEQEALTFIGRAIIRENNRSMSYRYDGRYDDENNDPDAYEWQSAMRHLPDYAEDPYFALKVLAYMDYHSCECEGPWDDPDNPDEWRRSDVHRWMTATEKAILASIPNAAWRGQHRWEGGRMVPLTYRDAPEWSRVPWGLDEYREDVSA